MSLNTKKFPETSNPYQIPILILHRQPQADKTAIVLQSNTHRFQFFLPFRLVLEDFEFLTGTIVTGLVMAGT